MQNWYADDSGVTGKICGLQSWFKVLSEEGQGYECNVNPSKSILLVEDPFLEEAHGLFDGTGVQVTEGVLYASSSIGEPAFRSHYASRKIREFAGEVDVLVQTARSEPHAAYSAVTHGSGGEEVRPLREAICSRLFPATTSRGEFAKDDLLLLELPARLGSLGIPDVGSVAEREFEASRRVSDSQVRALVA